MPSFCVALSKLKEKIRSILTTSTLHYLEAAVMMLYSSLSTPLPKLFSKYSICFTSFGIDPVSTYFHPKGTLKPQRHKCEKKFSSTCPIAWKLATKRALFNNMSHKIKRMQQKSYIQYELDQ